MVKFLSVAIFLIVLLSMAVFPQHALAQENEPELQIVAKYTKLEGKSGADFEFEVRVQYTGEETRTFDISVTGPKGWIFNVTPTYPKDRVIRDIRLEPASGLWETLLIHVGTPFRQTTEPGTYDFTFTMSDNDVQSSIALQAVITARYEMDIMPAGEQQLYNTYVQAGKDNVYSIKVENTGTDTLSNVVFSSDRPDDWVIEFNPDRLESLEAEQTQTIDVTIKSPAKAIAGDYQITLFSSAEEIDESNMAVRVTVETPTIWGWVGVGVIFAAVAGLGFFIVRFSRR
jgi:uncharacterized membrane protein